MSDGVQTCALPISGPAVTLRRETIARITAGPGSEEGKARLIARQQRAMTEEAQHRDEAAQNAAQLQKRGGV